MALKTYKPTTPSQRHLVLVDRTLAIRGYYRSDDEQELTRLLEDAARL